MNSWLEGRMVPGREKADGPAKMLSKEVGVGALSSLGCQDTEPGCQGEVGRQAGAV